eukprot:Sspe_Gene.50742::Locus_28228_Transcript_1_3_Confidence_0.500_Length_807::g.50742::m.50742/K16165/nagK; fumarylpyruvate hydrolase
MGDPVYAFPPQPVPTLSVSGSDEVVPVNRIFCVGRNYADHAREMGGDPDREPPFFFTKPASAVVDTSKITEVPYPSSTSNLHFEGELVVVLGPATEIFGFAVGVDLTRRDLQDEAKKMKRPWDSSKGFECSAPVGAVTKAADFAAVNKGGVDGEVPITLLVNGEEKQSSTLNCMVWSVSEVIDHLKKLYTLRAGDIIFTGTPAGVGPVGVNDEVVARVHGVADCRFKVTPPQ